MKNEQIKTMHLFAGIGGGLLADLILGHTPIVAVEWDRYACQVLRERAADGWFPNLRVWEGDVRLFDPSEYAGVVDCIHAGFPCQDISVAGKQAGIGKETRSGIYREVLRIAGVVRPKQLYLENVAAIVSGGLGTVLNDLAALGYDCEWLCIRASDCGANHHRDRWFLLANSNNNRCGDGPVQYVSGKQQCASDSGNDGKEAFMAYANGMRGLQPQGCECTQRGWSCNCGKDVADTDSARCKGHRRRIAEYTMPSVPSWWEVEPELGRVADGIPNRVGQLKGYGNAQVPIQAAMAYRLLGGR